MNEQAWTSLTAMLLEIEGREAQSGMLVYESGHVFVEDGRICWAAARGMASRLTDLLGEKARPGADLSALYRECRDRKRPLGETLVETGIVSAAELEAALRQHTAESLVQIVSDPGVGVWSPRTGGYAPRFTFTALQTFLDVAAVALGTHAEAAMQGLAALAKPLRHGAAFVAVGELAVPMAVAGDMRLRDLADLGGWATSLREAAHELAVEPGFAIGTTSAKRTTVVWWNELLTFALCTEDRAAVAEMTSYHLMRGRS